MLLDKWTIVLLILEAAAVNLISVAPEGCHALVMVRVHLELICAHLRSRQGGEKKQGMYVPAYKVHMQEYLC